MFEEYFAMKEATQSYEISKIQEDFYKDEIQHLKRELKQALRDLQRIKSVPLILGTLVELLNDGCAVVGSSTTGTQSLVRVSKSVRNLKKGSTIALHRHSSAIVDCLNEIDTTIRVTKHYKKEIQDKEKKDDKKSWSNIENGKWNRSLNLRSGQGNYLAINTKNYQSSLNNHSKNIWNESLFDDNAQSSKLQFRTPADTLYEDVGGLDVQKTELREAVELPLTHPHLLRAVGVEPPKGVLLYGPPGTGKTMLARAAANESNASFIQINGSSFVQKYLGEGPKLVRDVFKVARANAPCIVFIDEVDAIASVRSDGGTSADREVQRVLIELLNQLDGFDQRSNVVVVMATNRADTIDPALLRPGRLDRKIEFPLPNKKQKRLIYAAITRKMALGDDVDIDSLVGRQENLSPAEIQAVCQEAGMQAIRQGRYKVAMRDFEEAYQKITAAKQSKISFYT